MTAEPPERPGRGEGIGTYMLLTIDMGNTNIGLGLFKGSKLIQELRLPTDRRATARALQRRLKVLVGARRSGPWEGAMLASVVPDLDEALISAVRTVFKTEVLRITPALHLPVKNGYRKPAAVGADRLAAAVAAVAEFGAPVLVVDFGTAITVDAVSARGVYLGGAIFPGLRMAARALARDTALLPPIEIKPRRGLRPLGRTTQESLEAGIVLGAAGAVTFLVENINKEIGAPAPVVATGGLVSLVAPHCPAITAVRPYLIYDGLRLCWEHAGRTGQI